MLDSSSQIIKIQKLDTNLAPHIHITKMMNLAAKFDHILLKLKSKIFRTICQSRFRNPMVSIWIGDLSKMYSTNLSKRKTLLSNSTIITNCSSVDIE